MTRGRASTDPGPASEPLERSYRRWLRLFPAHWRRRREEEVLAVLLDASRPDQQRASAAERRDLAGAAALAWTRTTTAAARRAPGRAAGAVVLVVGVVAVALPAAGARQAGADALPSQLPGYGSTTGSVSGSPPGPAVALYQQGYGVELFDAPQAVVVGAGGSVRRLDLAEGRGEGAQGDPGAMLLSPDGRRVAVGRYDAVDGHPDVAVQDLTTGEVTRSAALGGRAVLPLAWSPDASTVLAVAREAAWDPFAGDADQTAWGAPALVGADGSVRALPAGAPRAVAAAAYSPDGRRLALQAPGGEVVLLDTTTGEQRDLGAVDQVLGSSAWSPDGRFLAVRRTCAVQLLEVGGSPPAPDGRAPACVPGVEAADGFVGWAGSRTIALRVAPEPAGGDLGSQPVVAVDVDSGTRTVLSVVPDAPGAFAVSRLQVPPLALAASAQRDGAVPAPRYERGHSSALLRMLGVALVAGAVGLLVAAAAALGQRAASRLRARAGGGPRELS